MVTVNRLLLSCRPAWPNPAATVLPVPRVVAKTVPVKAVAGAVVPGASKVAVLSAVAWAANKAANPSPAVLVADKVAVLSAVAPAANKVANLSAVAPVAGKAVSASGVALVAGKAVSPGVPAGGARVAGGASHRPEAANLHLLRLRKAPVQPPSVLSQKRPRQSPKSSSLSRSLFVIWLKRCASVPSRSSKP